MKTLAELRKQVPNAAGYSDSELLSFLSESTGRPLERVATDFGVDIGQNDGDFKRNVKGSWEGMKGAGAGAIGLAGGLVGADSVKAWGLGQAQENFDRAGLYHRESDDFTNIDGVGSAVDWAQGAAGNLAPQLLFGLGTAAAGGAIARRGVSALTRAAIEREVAGTAIMAGTESTAAGQLGRLSVNRVLNKAMERGAMAGAAAGSMGQEAGSIYPEMVAEGHDEPWRAAGYGIMAGAMDALPEMRAISKVFGGHAPGNMLARAAREGGKQALFEGGTEVGQTGLERNAAYKPLWNDEARNEYINAGAVGAVGGGMMGGVTGAVSRPPITDQKVDLLAPVSLNPNEQTSLLGNPAQLNPAAPTPVPPADPEQVYQLKRQMIQAQQRGDMAAFYQAQDALAQLPQDTRSRDEVAFGPDRLTIGRNADQASLFATPRTPAPRHPESGKLLLPPREPMVAPEHAGSGAAPTNSFESATVRAAHIVRAGVQAPVALRGDPQFFSDFSNAAALLGEHLGAGLNDFLVQTTGKDVAHVNQLLAGGSPAPAKESPTVSTPAGTQTARVPVVKGVAVPPAGESTAPVVKDEEAVTLLRTAGVNATGARVQRVNALIELRDAGSLESGEFDHAVQSLKGNRFGVADEVIRLAGAAKQKELDPFEKARAIMEALSERERDILTRVNAQEDMADIGKLYGITKDAVSKAHRALLEKVASTSAALGVDPRHVLAAFAVRQAKGIDAANLEYAPEAQELLAVNGMGEQGSDAVSKYVGLEDPGTDEGRDLQHQATQLLKAAVASPAVQARATLPTPGGELMPESEEVQARRNAEITARNTATTHVDAREEFGRQIYEADAAGDDPKWTDFSPAQRATLTRAAEGVNAGTRTEEQYNAAVGAAIQQLELIAEAREDAAAYEAEGEHELAKIAQAKLQLLEDDIAGGAALTVREGDAGTGRGDLNPRDTAHNSKENEDGEGTEGQDAPVDGQGVEGRGSEGSQGGRQVPPEVPPEEEVGRLQFSKREGEGGSSADAVRSKLQKLFFSRDRFNQRITIVQTEEEAARLSSKFAATYSSKTDKGQVQGFVHGDKIVLVAGNIAPGKELAVFLHEVGVHIGLTNLLTSEQWLRLTGQIASWAQRDDGSLEARIARKAHDRVMAAHGDIIGGVSDLDAVYQEELVAYFVEEAVLAGVDPLAASSGSTALDQWFRTLWAAAKMALRKIGLGRFDQLSAQNIVDLTFGAARLEITGVWSGFAIKFRNPLDKYVGAGEGTSWESWGHYASQARKVARSYMRADEARKLGDGPIGVVRSNGRELLAAEVELLVRAGAILPRSALAKEIPPSLAFNPRAKVEAYVRDAEENLVRIVEKNYGGIDFRAQVALDVATGRALLEGKRLKNLELIPVPVPEGRLYRSDVALDDDRVLQWRAPLAEQPEVQAALEQALTFARDYTATWGFQTALNDVRAGGLRGGDIIRQLESLFSVLLNDGASALKGLMPDEDLKRVKEAAYEPQQFAAVAFLRDKAGLQGVRYSTAHADGKDNVVVWSEGRIQRVATQINGDDEKIRFSKNVPPAAAKVDSVVQQAFDSPAWATAKHHARKVNYALLFGHQLVEKIGALIPAAKTFFQSLQQKVALRERREEQVLEMADKFYRMPVAAQAQANTFMQESTVSQKWGYQPEWDAQAQVDADMAAKFKALPAEAQVLVKKVFAYGNETQREYTQVLQKLVDAELLTQVAEAKASKDESRLKALEKERARLMQERGGLRSMLAGPYAPLVRFGQYVVAVKSPEFRAAEAASDGAAKEKLQSDPAHYTVRFYETMYEAQKAHRAMRAEYGDNVDEPVQREPENTHSSELPVQAIKRVQHALETGPDGEKLSASTRRILTRITADLYVASLDSLSARHSQQRRRNIAGADGDMMRAFVSHGQGMARLLAALETTDAMQESLQEMRAQARRGQRTTEKNDALNEVLMRYASMMESRPTPVQDKLMATTSIWLLLTNPAYWASNGLQPGMMSLPVLAGRYGMGRAMKAMVGGYKRLRGAFDGRTFDPSKIQNPVARSAEMLQALLDRGHIDLTLEQDLGRFANPGAFGSAAAQKVMSALRVIPQRVEIINRVSTALAAYELEYVQLTSKGVDPDLAHEQATEYADSVILDTHGDYSAAGAPRALMQGGKRLPVKLMGQFRKFQLIQLALVTKLARQSFSGKMSREERAVGRASLGWLLGVYGATTGLTGIVGVKTLAWVLTSIFGDDDEKDLDLILTRELGDRAAAQLLLHGVPALLGMDVSNRLGMGNVTSPFPFADHEPSYRKTYENYLMAATGPFVGGLVPRTASGLDYMRKGQYWKGLEMLLPNGLTNALRAARMAEGGVTNSKGDTLLESDELEALTVLFQAAGLPTTQLTERQWKSDALYDMDSRMRDRVNTIRTQYADAAKEGDRDAMGDLRQEWMDVQEMRKRNGMKPQPLSKLLKVPKDQREREALADEGVALTTANAGFVASIGGN